MQFSGLQLKRNFYQEFIMSNQGLIKKILSFATLQKGLMFWPYPHTENFKQWNLPEVHTVLKCHAFDKDLEEYVKLKKQYEENRNEEVIYG